MGIWEGIKEGNIGPKRYYLTESEMRKVFREHGRKYRKSERIQHKGIIYEWDNYITQ